MDPGSAELLQLSPLKIDGSISYLIGRYIMFYRQCFMFLDLPLPKTLKTTQEETIHRNVHINQGRKLIQIIQQMISNYRIIRRLKRSQLNMGTAAAAAASQPLQKSCTFHPLAYIANGLVVRAFYYPQRGFICFLGNLKCLIQDPLRPARGRAH